ncbi:hypothetical protein FOA52_014003 [Chlamydomonas sp. UWO 241]|nr:hypothetical protein FOA52_014003 [Chlamydomonas sp. UWO 241]
MSLALRHLLIPVDESKASRNAFQWAIDHLYRPGDTVHLFHVVTAGVKVFINTDLGLDEIVDDGGENSRKLEEEARDYLTSTFVPVLEEKKIPYQVEIVRFATDNESIGAVVCKRAAVLNAAAVVMAKHARGSIAEFFVGSVTSYCTHNCASPVLVMHAD